MKTILDPRGASGEDLLEAYQGLVLNLVDRYGQDRSLREDLKQEGALAVLEAGQTYDPSRGVAFPHYVKEQVKYAIFAYQRRAWAYEGRKGAGGREALEALQGDLDLEEDLVRKEEEDVLREKLGVLSPRQREVVVLYYQENLSLSEIAGFLGLAYKTVENTKAAGLEKLRRAYGLK